MVNSKIYDVDLLDLIRLFKPDICYNQNPDLIAALIFLFRVFVASDFPVSPQIPEFSIGR